MPAKIVSSGNLHGTKKLRICLISHTNFLGNSAMHVFSLVKELQELGHECVIAVPDSPETIHKHRPPTCPIVDYPTAMLSGLPFESGEGPDLVHGWSPRDHVLNFTLAMAKRYGCPYFVHMEDNEEQIVSDEAKGIAYDDLKQLPSDLIDRVIGPYRSHPHRYRDFVDNAAGYSCLIDRLLEFKSQRSTQPDVVFWAGFEDELLTIDGRDEKKRLELGIAPDETIIFYGGNVHHSIASDVTTLYLAVMLLRRKGLKIRLLRTGWNYAPLGLDGVDGLSNMSIELGFVARHEMKHLMGAADILVQPGKSDAFNDYRFPSKLPEFLASGKPVILPDTNIGKELTEGTHCLKLISGTVTELIEKIEKLIANPALASHLGVNGRSFAQTNLTWSASAKKLERLYERTLVSKPAAIATAENSASTAKVTKIETGSDDGAKRRVRFPVKLLAYYLPQFHPIPENDKWWGAGFTEWTNVVRAKPQFQGHAHPRLPTELGFYDLRVAETLTKQADLAREHGISGFCFYYYWFNGKRLLERPLDVWLSTQGPEFPFCICWANENWSRRWDGSENDVLIEQTYNPDNDLAFITDLIPILKDERYICVNGAPLIQLYRASVLPDPIATARTWREVAAKNGIPKLHLSIVQSFGQSDPRTYGFDSAIEFSPPHVERQLVDPKALPTVDPDFEGYIEDYIGVAIKSINAAPTDFIRYRGCFPMWDNTARRKNKGHIFINDSPKAYAQWLRFLVREALLRRDQVEPLVFINAWNEWAEGTYLEPDERYGRGLLEVTRAALEEGIVDAACGLDAERERSFVNKTSILPKTTNGRR